MDSPRMEQESSSSSSSSTLTNPMQGAGGGGGPAADAQQAKRPHLSIDIPAPSTSSVLLTPTAAEADSVPTTPPGSNASRTPGSASGSGKNGAPGKPPAPQRTPSFKLRQTVRSLLPGGGSFKSSVRGYEASLSRLFSGRIARTSSLPVVDDVLSASVHGVDKTLPTATAAADKTGIHRSQSLPMNMKKFNSAKSIKRMNSLGGVYRVVPSTPRVPAATAATSNAVPDIVPTEPGAGEEGDEDHGENIAEEEAVCRICMVELSEGGGAMKLECACKGELALAHTDCALKWFGIKGTRTCEVCKQEVQNLPVTLMRLQSARGGEPGRTGANGPRYVRYRLCHGTPILVIISILAYFCFLEQLLVAHNGFAALAISLPFSCILGLFSSLTTTSMVARRYVWIYAAVQFLFVVFFTHLFYRYLHLQAVISIILATFAGFGVGMIGNSIIIEVLRWRAMTPAQSRRARRPPRVPQQQQALASGQPSDQPSAPVEEQRNTAVDVENPAIPQA